MTRLLPLLNLAGILLLVALCCAQWQADHQLRQQLASTEQTNRTQQATLTERNTAIRSQAADLDDFRTRLARAATASKEIQSKLDAALAERAQLLAEQRQLQTAYETVKTSLDKWTAAVAARDDALKTANTLAEKLAADRNQAIEKYNALVTQYNAAAAEIKKAAASLQSLAAQRNDAIAKFNDLAAKYNALITGKPPSTAPSTNSP